MAQVEDEGCWGWCALLFAIVAMMTVGALALPRARAGTTATATSRWTLGGGVHSDKGRWCRQSGFCGGVIDVDLLEKEQRAGLLKGGEGALHLEVGDHVTELATEPTEEGEHEGVVANRVTELGEGATHRHETATKVGDR